MHGTVVAPLYPLYADYKWSPIPQREFDESVLADETVEVLETVYNTYGSFSGDQLESLSHSEEPWKAARGSLKPWKTGNVPVSCAVTREYYGKKYEQAQND